jgi:hypothetical protein
MCSDSDFFLTGPEEHVLKNRSVFMKIRETGLDRFHRFLINLNLIFLNFLIFFKKGFIGFGTGLPVLPTGLLVSMDFNHYRPIGLLVSIPVYRSYRLLNRSH